MSNQIAQTIMQQIGGNRFAVMTGAKQFVALGNGLQFKLPSNFAKKGINCIKITLTPADLYDVEFFKIRGMNVTEVEKSEGLYADMLQSEFRRVTGLDTHL